MEDFQSKPEWLEGINLLNDIEGYFIFRVVTLCTSKRIIE